jgi:hypothetical protein
MERMLCRYLDFRLHLTRFHSLVDGNWPDWPCWQLEAADLLDHSCCVLQLKDVLSFREDLQAHLSACDVGIAVADLLRSLAQHSSRRFPNR